MQGLLSIDPSVAQSFTAAIIEREYPSVTLSILVILFLINFNPAFLPDAWHQAGMTGSWFTSNRSSFRPFALHRLLNGRNTGRMRRAYPWHQAHSR